MLYLFSDESPLGAVTGGADSVAAGGCASVGATDGATSVFASSLLFVLPVSAGFFDSVLSVEDFEDLLPPDFLLEDVFSPVFLSSDFEAPDLSSDFESLDFLPDVFLSSAFFSSDFLSSDLLSEALSFPPFFAAAASFSFCTDSSRDFC